MRGFFEKHVESLSHLLNHKRTYIIIIDKQCKYMYMNQDVAMETTVYYVTMFGNNSSEVKPHPPTSCPMWECSTATHMACSMANRSVSLAAVAHSRSNTSLRTEFISTAEMHGNTICHTQMHGGFCAHNKKKLNVGPTIGQL